MGNIASEIATNEFNNYLDNIDTVNEKIIKDCICKVNRVILNKQAELKAKNRLRTTLAALVICKEKAYLCHVGNSRIYAFENTRTIYRTRDHSVPEMLALSGHISEQAIRYHPDRNKVLQVLGMNEDVFKCAIH